MARLSNDEIREIVRQKYGEVAASATAGCGCSSSSCCSPSSAPTAANLSLALGYTKEDVTGVPEGANMGLGCGNPQAIASLLAGEVVLDLGSGGGFDCFLAARAVGEKGLVIGVDMTPAMVSKARENARQAGVRNVDFRLGEIEHLPVADGSVDVIISNCVINLSPEKENVFAEAFRVLKPGGRLAISDIVALTEFPPAVKQDMALYTGCVAGASSVSNIESMLARAGFESIQVRPKDESRAFIQEWVPGSKIEDYVASATIEAVKPLQ
jgi:SAM-dependent methyltransferase